MCLGDAIKFMDSHKAWAGYSSCKVASWKAGNVARWQLEEREVASWQVAQLVEFCCGFGCLGQLVMCGLWFDLHASLCHVGWPEGLDQHATYTYTYTQSATKRHSVASRRLCLSKQQLPVPNFGCFPFFFLGSGGEIYEHF